MIRHLRLSSVCIAMGFGALFWPGALAGHEKGVLRVAAREVAAGDTLHVAGAKFTRGLRLTLTLSGTAGRWELGTLETDSAGAFHAALGLPADLVPGAYRLVAVAPDGDQVAGADVAIVERMIQSRVPDVLEHVGHAPSAEPLALDRARSPFVTGGAVVVAALALAAGVGLLRRPA